MPKKQIEGKTFKRRVNVLFYREDLANLAAIGRLMAPVLGASTSDVVRWAMVRGREAAEREAMRRDGPK